MAGSSMTGILDKPICFVSAATGGQKAKAAGVYALQFDLATAAVFAASGC